MAWTDIGAGAGIWNGLSISEPAGSSTPDLKTILRELITAIWEREEIMKAHYGTVTLDNYTFRKADGSYYEGDDFSALTDFDGMTIRGTDSDYHENIQRMQIAIERLVERSNCLWCPDSTTRDDWLDRVEDLLDLGSYGGTWLSPTDALVTETDLIHQIREALDGLVYPIFGLRLGLESGATGGVQRKRSSAGDFDAQWTNMLGEAWESGGTTNIEFEATVACSNGGTAQYSHTISASPGKLWLSANVVGTLLEGIYVVYTTNGVHSGTLQAANSKFSDSFDSGDATTYHEYSTGTSWPNVGSDTAAEESAHVAIPTSNPFTSAGSAQIYCGRRLAPGDNASDMKTASKIKQYCRAYCQLVPGTDLTYG